MTDSTLSSKYSDIRQVVAHYLGMSLTSTDWSTDDQTIIGMIMKRGLSQFYFPPKIRDDEEPHEWSFLKPTTTLDTVASYSTGTIAVALAGTTVTITTGVWPSWAATHGTLVVDGTEYAIASRTDDDEIELSSAWTETTETVAEYTLQHDGNYDLPDNHGGIEGKLTFESSNSKPDILIVGEGRIRSLRNSLTSRSNPYYAAVRPKTTDGALGQRFEIMFFPIPDDAYTLSYKMMVLASALTSDIEYPYGGAIHANTIEASCLAAAEMQEDEKKGAQWGYFMERLTASIQLDKTANSAEYFGYNSDNSDNRGKGRTIRNQKTVSYDGGS